MTHTRPKQTIPKIIHTLWHDADRNSWPDVVRVCLDRWQALNPDHVLKVHSRADADAIMKGIGVVQPGMTLQAFSDVFRARLLRDDGGIWVDATLLPVQPLGDWLQARACSGFFAFEKPGRDRPIASWFLAAAPHHPVISEWWAEIERYWSKPRTLIADPRDGPVAVHDPVAAVSPDGEARQGKFPYFWFHYLFARLLDTDPVFHQRWQACDPLPASSPHSLQNLFRDRNLPPASQIADALATAPVQKLNWRKEYPLGDIQTLMEKADLERSALDQV